MKLTDKYPPHRTFTSVEELATFVFSDHIAREWGGLCGIAIKSCIGHHFGKRAENRYWREVQEIIRRKVKE
jgi:hypothetical protein